MANHYDEYAYENENSNIKGLVTGLLVGALVGAAVMLFVAPQSGRDTRKKLQKKTLQLRDHTMDTVDDAVKQARHKVDQVSADVRKQAGELQDRGQHLYADQRERVTDMVNAGKKKIHLPGR